MTRELQPCGTLAAARRHRYNNELVDPPCHAAEAEHARKQREAKRKASLDGSHVADDAKQLPTLRERLLDKTVVNLETDCWEWTACKGSSGYGQIRVGKSMRAAHRIAYEMLVGPIPAGLQLDHLCRVRHCINPAHLEPVTNRENQMRSPIAFPALNAAKTHCPAGHKYNSENTHISSKGRRHCRACVADRKTAAQKARAQ